MDKSLNPVGIIILLIGSLFFFLGITGIYNSIKAAKAESTILYTKDADKRRRFIRHCLDMGNIATINQFSNTVEVTCKPFK